VNQAVREAVGSARATAIRALRRVDSLVADRWIKQIEQAPEDPATVQRALAYVSGLGGIVNGPWQDVLDALCQLHLAYVEPAELATLAAERDIYRADAEALAGEIALLEMHLGLGHALALDAQRRGDTRAEIAAAVRALTGLPHVGRAEPVARALARAHGHPQPLSPYEHATLGERVGAAAASLGFAPATTPPRFADLCTLLEQMAGRDADPAESAGAWSLDGHAEVDLPTAVSALRAFGDPRGADALRADLLEMDVGDLWHVEGSPSVVRAR
jgi:hypothetical protein